MKQTLSGSYRCAFILVWEGRKSRSYATPLEMPQEQRALFERCQEAGKMQTLVIADQKAQALIGATSAAPPALRPVPPEWTWRVPAGFALACAAALMLWGVAALR